MRQCLALGQAHTFCCMRTSFCVAGGARVCCPLGACDAALLAELVCRAAPCRAVLCSKPRYPSACPASFPIMLTVPTRAQRPTTRQTSPASRRQQAGRRAGGCLALMVRGGVQHTRSGRAADAAAALSEASCLRGLPASVLALPHACTRCLLTCRSICTYVYARIRPTPPTSRH